MSELKNKGVYSAIAKYLKKNLAETEGVLELGIGDGGLGEFLFNEGIKNYHGIDVDESKVQAAKKRVPSLGNRFRSSVGKAKRDIVICLNGTPFETIHAGQRMIVLTSGFDNYDALCTAIGGLYHEGATTIQHENLFLTYGVRA
jgi:hypothetical protein